MLGDLVAQIEAALFSSSEPLRIQDLERACECPTALVEQALHDLESYYKEQQRGIRLEQSGAGVRLVTAPEAAVTIARLHGTNRRPRLSPAALDTLAIVAYRQPTTRAEVEAIRGVGCEHVLAVLINYGLVEETGRSEALGRPLLYGTTPEFLGAVGITSLSELPPIAS